MKSKLYSLLLSVCLIGMLFSGCGKASHNGKVDGNWQIMSIENLKDGTTSSPEQHYIALYLHVVNLFPNYIAGNMQYDKDQDKISMDFPYSTAEQDKQLLRRYGIYTNPIVFEVVKADSKQLVLRSPDTMITCRRY